MARPRKPDDQKAENRLTKAQRILLARIASCDERGLGFDLCDELALRGLERRQLAVRADDGVRRPRAVLTARGRHEATRKRHTIEVGGGGRTRAVVRSSSRLVREFFQLLDDTGKLYKDVSVEAGVSHNTMNQWKRGFKPSADSLDAAGNVIGYRLAWVPLEA